MSNVWKGSCCTLLLPKIAPKMSRRYYIPMAPVAHINGKIAPAAYKAANTDDPEKTEIDGYFYGYRHKFSKKNCFAIRKRCRDLTKKPYTTAEQENRDLFSITLLEVNIHWHNLAERALCILDFDRQTYYHTPRGFAVALVRENGGEWLPEWTTTPAQDREQ